MKVLGIVWLFLAEVPVLCSGSCWTETSSRLWSGVGDICGRSGECMMGCDYARWCHSISGDRSIYWPKGRVSCCSGWKRSVRCAFLNCYFCCGGNGGGTVTCLNVSPFGDHNRWSVICPFGYGCIDALNEICLRSIAFLREEACWGSLA